MNEHLNLQKQCKNICNHYFEVVNGLVTWKTLKMTYFWQILNTKFKKIVQRKFKKFKNIFEDFF